MTVDEALALLGVDAQIQSSELRRAYLRAVKAHPPERDADGFRRVREAYDLLRDQLPIHRQLIMYRDPQDRSREQPAGVDPVVEPPCGEPEEVPSSEAPASEPSREPFPPALEDDLSDELYERQQKLWEEPESLSDDELVGLEELGMEDELAHAWLERGRPMQAKRLLLTHFEASRSQGVQAPSAHVTVHTLLALLAHRKPKAFVRLMREFRQSLNDTGQLYALMGDSLALWSLLTELDAVRQDLEPELVVLLARLMTKWEVVDTDVALSRYREQDPHAARAAARVLEEQAPNLYLQFGAILKRETQRSREVSEERQRPSRGSSIAYWPIFLGIFAMLNLFSRSCSSPEDRPRPQPQRTLPGPGVEGRLKTNEVVILDALSRGACISARRALREALAEPLTGEEIGRFSALARRVDAECPDSGFASEAGP